MSAFVQVGTSARKRMHGQKGSPREFPEFSEALEKGRSRIAAVRRLRRLAETRARELPGPHDVRHWLSGLRAELTGDGAYAPTEPTRISTPYRADGAR